MTQRCTFLFLYCFLGVLVIRCSCGKNTDGNDGLEEILEEEIAPDQRDQLNDGDIDMNVEVDVEDHETSFRCGNGVVESGEECDDENTEEDDGCDNHCAFSCHADEECDDGLACTENACDVMDTHACSHDVSPSTKLCRPWMGFCDVEEYCDGTNPDCPVDGFADYTVECRPRYDDCDTAESCTGTSADCPPDSFAAEGTSCDDGIYCTVDECDGRGVCIGTLVDEPHAVSSVEAGQSHTCAVLTGGGVRCWGYNGSGQLGDGTRTGRLLPVDVRGLLPDVVSIAAGDSHTCALSGSGGVKCWGDNLDGQLGDGTTTSRTSPVDVLGLSSGVTSLSSSFRYTCAVLSSGGVKCWGSNWEGCLGDGTTTTRTSPVDVLGLSSGVVSVSAGISHTCAVLSGGGVKCWGQNGFGELGDGTTITRTSPVDVLGLSSGVVSVSAGGSQTCAVLGSGGVKCWGRNRDGELGNGTHTDSSTPVNVMGLSSGVASISAGREHACALLESGGVKCWGYNGSGGLGDGTTLERTSPVDAVGLSSGVASITAGRYHTCAVSSGGEVKCWGENSAGQIGNGTTTVKTFPVGIEGFSSGVSSIAAGGGHTCFISSGGGVQCFGNNSNGQLGDGTTMCSISPVDVLGLSSGISSITAGDSHTCAVSTGGGVQCWGKNSFGQLGNGTTTDSATAVNVSGLDSGITSISAGYEHTCAVSSSGGVKCWGSNRSSQIGGILDRYTATPVDIERLSSNVSSIATGFGHTCALLMSGGVMCWGSNRVGQLGDGTGSGKDHPVNVIGLSSGVASIATSDEHTCAVMSTGDVKCWGGNFYGQLGDGTTNDRNSPVDVMGLPPSVFSIAAGSYHTCALLSGGGIKCWGEDRFGQVTGFFQGYPQSVSCL